MSIKAKPILKDKFWIVEKDGENFGTLSINEDKYMFSSSEGIKFFDNKKQLEKSIGNTIFEIQEHITNSIKEVNGYPCNSVPHNSMYDVKRKLPLFTKSSKSKSLYCAGYYIIKFDKGWVKSFCPKLITIERYVSKGPFKTEIEMRQELSNASNRSN